MLWPSTQADSKEDYFGANKVIYDVHCDGWLRSRDALVASRRAEYGERRAGKTGAFPLARRRLPLDEINRHGPESPFSLS